VADTVTVPGVKKPLPKWAVGAGIGGVAVGIIYYFRKKSAAPATAAATSTDQYPPDGTTGNPSDPYSTDPATGTTYGDEAAGSGGAYGAFSSSGTSDQGVIGYDAGGNPIYAPGYGPGASGTTTGGPPFSTNSDWSNWVIAQLEVNDPNLSTTDVQNAIGAYLAGQPLTAAQKTIVFDATAVGQDPPVAGANGYPPKVLATGTAGGSTTPKQVKVPNVAGKTVNQAQDAIKAAGLTVNPDTAKDKKGYIRKVTAENPKAGTTAATGTHVGLTWHYVKQ
jgi:PASTA domain